MAGPKATTEVALPYDAVTLAAWLREFRESQSSGTDRLEAAEQARLVLLEDDLVRLATAELAGRAQRRSLLHAMFNGFETLWGSAADTLARFGEMLAGIPRWLGERAGRKHRKGAPGNGVFARDYAVFDRLSTHYGGQYRGGIVSIYRLAIVAVLLTLLSRLGREICIGEGAAFWLGVAELVVLAVALALWLVGRTPETHGRHRLWHRIPSRSWRQRWLEYRLLAERFRYAELMRATGKPLAVAWQALLAAHPGAHWIDRHLRKPGEYWHERIFIARLQAVPDARADAGFPKHFESVLLEQHAYHKRVMERRGRIVHRLHWVANACFIGALALTVLHVPLIVPPDWLNDFFRHWLETLHHGKGPVILLAGLLTGVAAAVHGTLATGEYPKLAEISREMTEELASLVDTTKAKRDAGADALALVPEVESFCRLVTEDATGWTLLLRDKDLPKGGHG